MFTVLLSCGGGWRRSPCGVSSHRRVDVRLRPPFGDGEVRRGEHWCSFRYPSARSLGLPSDIMIIFFPNHTHESPVFWMLLGARGRVLSWCPRHRRRLHGDGDCSPRLGVCLLEGGLAVGGGPAETGRGGTPSLVPPACCCHPKTLLLKVHLRCLGTSRLVFSSSRETPAPGWGRGRGGRDGMLPSPQWIECPFSI